MHSTTRAPASGGRRGSYVISKSGRWRVSQVAGQDRQTRDARLANGIPGTLRLHDDRHHGGHPGCRSSKQYGANCRLVAAPPSSQR